MTYREAVKQFKREYRWLYINKADYWQAHQEWVFFVDDLNRCGDITDKQASTWSTPFPYGKRLEPSKAQLEYEVYCTD